MKEKYAVVADKGASASWLLPCHQIPRSFSIAPQVSAALKEISAKEGGRSKQKQQLASQTAFKGRTSQCDVNSNSKASVDWKRKICRLTGALQKPGEAIAPKQ